MAGVAREKYAKLMQEIENLEDMLAEMKNPSTGSPSINERLAAKRDELAKLSDGRGRPHPC